MVITGKGYFNELEKAYVCKFYEHDGRESLADSLNRNEVVISNLYYRLRNENLLEYYTKKWDEFMLEGLE